MMRGGDCEKFSSSSKTEEPFCFDDGFLYSLCGSLNKKAFDKLLF